ncbi:MAG: molybdenum cofactor guanylyltransferase [Opitutaceae bacterium]|nr:molybdenum cofactor guanylyltransferase [Opitutaceae bacterium]
MAVPQAVSFDGVVLAGGRSRRMGRDKALLPAPDGRALWQRQVELLRSAGVQRVWISAREDQTWAVPEAAVVRDEVTDAGPLAGVVAAWRRSQATHLIVLAVDLPDLPLSWLLRLQQASAVDVGVVGLRPGGPFEPLAASYPRSWRPAWEDALGAGRLGLQRLLIEARSSGALREIMIGPENAPWFRNLNTPADLASE